MKPLPKTPVLTAPLRGLLCFWALAAVVLGSLFPVASAHAQFPVLINRSDWWRNGSTLDLDFANDRYWLNGTSYTTVTDFISGAGATFTRSSSATYFDSSGVLQTAPSGTVRMDYESSGTGIRKGALIEESRTNYISNSIFSGAVAGYPGTWPTNFSLSTSTSGVTLALVGTGTEFGMPYIDVRASGTSVVTSTLYIGMVGYRHVGGAATGDAWTASLYARKVSGTLPSGGFVQLYLFTFNPSNTVLASLGQSYSDATLSVTTPYRMHVTSTSLTFPSGTGSVALASHLTWPALTTNDVTMRYYAPQLEKGAFPTSHIPTFGTAAVTRALDVFTVPVTAAGASGAWYTQGIGTLGAVGVMDCCADVVLNAGIGVLAALDDGTATNYIDIDLPRNTLRRRILLTYNSSQDYLDNTGALYTQGALYKGVIAFQNGDQGAAKDGTLLTAGTAPTVPTMTRLKIGGYPGAVVGGGVGLDGWVRRIWYMPTRQPDHTLADYTR